MCCANIPHKLVNVFFMCTSLLQEDFVNSSQEYVVYRRTAATRPKKPAAPKAWTLLAPLTMTGGVVQVWLPAGGGGTTTGPVVVGGCWVTGGGWTGSVVGQGMTSVDQVGGGGATVLVTGTWVLVTWTGQMVVVAGMVMVVWTVVDPGQLVTSGGQEMTVVRQVSVMVEVVQE